jgi:hypothetical protein
MTLAVDGMRSATTGAAFREVAAVVAWWRT